VALTGYGEEELVGRSVTELPAAGEEWARRELARLAASGEWRGELDLCRADGSAVPVDVVVTTVALPGETAYVAVVRDMSERRALERLQEEFVANVAHDLKNPLATIRGQAQLLRRRLARGEPPDPDRLLTGMAAIDAGAERMVAMIDDLVDVARLRGGQPLELRRQPVDLGELARRAIEEVDRSHERHPIRLVAPEEPVVGLWDGGRLERVVANLLSNAVKYSPEGGEVVVRVGREEDAGRVCAVLAVEDHGVGIPAADLPHIFDRYRRGRNVGGIVGSGIGLSGARTIVEQHGGTIAVRSTEGEGSTFTVRLPLDET
jgi:signal transduction histidine kinase